MKRIYLDHNATCPLDKRVLEAMLPYFAEKFGNASSLHSFGQEARNAIEGARESVATLLNAAPSEIIFTSGGTESNNMVLKGYGSFIQKEQKQQEGQLKKWDLNFYPKIHLMQ